MIYPCRGGGGRPHQGHAQAQLQPQGRHPEARPASSSTEVGMRLPPKMTPAQIAEAQRMAREWKRLGAPGKSRSERAWDERAAPREGSFARPTEPERGRSVGYRPEHFRPIVAPRTAGVDVNRSFHQSPILTRPSRLPDGLAESSRARPADNRPGANAASSILGGLLCVGALATAHASSSLPRSSPSPRRG